MQLEINKKISNKSVDFLVLFNYNLTVNQSRRPLLTKQVPSWFGQNIFIILFWKWKVGVNYAHFFCDNLNFENILRGYPAIKDLLINEQINAKEVRLNGENGVTYGIVTLSEAKKIAEEQELDLVLISPVAVPPVCKVMDYGKYRFDMLKREKEAKKKQKVAEVKGMQLSMNIADNDLQFKAKNVRKFLTNGDKVKVVLRMFGRQLANPQLGMPIMQKFAEMLSDVGEVTSPAAINGKQIIMVISPKNTK